MSTRSRVSVSVVCAFGLNAEPPGGPKHCVHLEFCFFAPGVGRSVVVSAPVSSASISWMYPLPWVKDGRNCQPR